MITDSPISVVIDRFQVADPTHGAVECIELRPGADRSLPLILFLPGGGGSAESLLALQPLVGGLWQSGRLPACRIVTPSVDPWGFYLDDPPRGYAWESFIRERLLPRLQAPGGGQPGSQPTGLLGISMGGYGALKIAFAQPHQVRAVAAVSPMLEPALCVADVRPRNRYHYPPQVPAALLGSQRDAALYAADHPAGRAQRQADDLRTSALAIYLDAAADDALHAQDGAEFLHRVLWELDLPHDYHLVAAADHLGPSLLPRIEAAFTWLGAQLAPPEIADSPLEQAWRSYLDAGATSAPPVTPLPPTSPLAPRLLRHLLASQHAAAAAEDDTMSRRLGRLPGPLAAETRSAVPPPAHPRRGA